MGLSGRVTWGITRCGLAAQCMRVYAAGLMRLGSLCSEVALQTTGGAGKLPAGRLVEPVVVAHERRGHGVARRGDTTGPTHVGGERVGGAELGRV
jgi:hypothetical protein